ncbi:hypothetical protein AVEN_81540-1 [Araneus ventricosus]|uniref:Uncharacterized protein n=1 Tax=Araneus ventricosus TaxID=182803 RepID=A0A4Y2I3K5_ARAVE|nr:hypothetical protein AVEN_81540-1 [Araneus ventricosus]
MLTPSQGIYNKWHFPRCHFSKSERGTKSHLSRLTNGNPMAKPRKISSGSEAAKNSPLKMVVKRADTGVAKDNGWLMEASVKSRRRRDANCAHKKGNFIEFFSFSILM